MDKDSQDGSEEIAESISKRHQRQKALQEISNPSLDAANRPSSSKPPSREKAPQETTEASAPVCEFDEKEMRSVSSTPVSKNRSTTRRPSESSPLSGNEDTDSPVAPPERLCSSMAARIDDQNAINNNAVHVTETDFSLALLNTGVFEFPMLSDRSVPSLAPFETHGRDQSLPTSRQKNTTNSSSFERDGFQFMGAAHDKIETESLSQRAQDAVSTGDTSHVQTDHQFAPMHPSFHGAAPQVPTQFLDNSMEADHFGTFPRPFGNQHETHAAGNAAAKCNGNPYFAYPGNRPLVQPLAYGMKRPQSLSQQWNPNRSMNNQMNITAEMLKYPGGIWGHDNLGDQASCPQPAERVDDRHYETTLEYIDRLENELFGDPVSQSGMDGNYSYAGGYAGHDDSELTAHMPRQCAKSTGSNLLSTEISRYGTPQHSRPTTTVYSDFTSHQYESEMLEETAARSDNLEMTAFWRPNRFL